MSKIAVSVDLRASFGPARDQGGRPTCLAFAASDTHAAVREGWDPLSCEYVFYHAQRRAGRASSAGAILSAILEALQKDGQPEEEGWPYLAAVPAEAESWIPPQQKGELFRRNGAKASHALDMIIQTLDQGRPVIVLTKLSRSFYQKNPQSIVDPSDDEKPDDARRHAVVAVGHGLVDSQRAVLVRNSWGPGWGDAGHGWLTERFLGPRIYAAATLLEEINVSAHPNAA